MFDQFPAFDREFLASADLHAADADDLDLARTADAERGGIAVDPGVPRRRAVVHAHLVPAAVFVAKIGSRNENREND